MNRNCKNCESQEYTTENHEIICTNCGEVQEEFADEGRLCMLPDNDAVVSNFRNKDYDANQRLTGRIRGETNSAETRRRICRDKLLDELRKIVKQLIKHPGAAEETMDLVNITVQAYKGRLLNSKKLGLVGACIYYLSAKHQLGISLTDICRVVNIKMKVISTCLKQVRQLCPNFEYERPNMRDLVKKYIDELALKHYEPSLTEANSLKGGSFNKHPGALKNEPQPLIDKKDRDILENRVMLLLELFEAMHPYNQPTPQSLIIAVIYYAWRSLDTFKLIAVNLSSGLRDISTHELASHKEIDHEDQTTKKKAFQVKHSLSFEKFCQVCDLKCRSSGYKIVSKLQSSLLKLGKYLGDVNKINLPWYLKDIIENSPHLIQEHMRTELVPKKNPGDEFSTGAVEDR